MTKPQIGALLASLAAASLMTAKASAKHHEKSAGENGHLCQNNKCKGHAECMGYGNASCHGQNSCKGKGWITAATEAECKSKGGIWHGAVNEPTPEKKSVKNKKG